MAAIVWNFGAEAPMAQISNQTGFILQGDGDAEAVVNTGKTWKSAMNPAVTLLPIDRQSIAYEYFVGGPGEMVDASRYPWGWERPDFDDSSPGPPPRRSRPAAREGLAIRRRAGSSCRAASR